MPVFGFGTLPSLAPVEFLQEVGEFFSQLDAVREEIEEAAISVHAGVIGSSLTGAMGLSVGYLLWLTRGGLLLASLVSTMPAWRLIDPLPVLAHLGDGDDDDQDSLDSMIRERAGQAS